MATNPTMNELNRPVADYELEAMIDRACLDDKPLSLSALKELQALRVIVNRYRYATQWTAADAWDFCSDCQDRIKWAHAHDTERLSVNEVAAVGKTYLALTKPRETVRRHVVEHAGLWTMACGRCHGLISVEGVKVEETFKCSLCGTSYTYKGEIHDETIFEME